MALPFDETQIFSGAKGKMIDANGMVMQETQEFTASLNQEFADVKLVGTPWTGKKLVGLSGTGTLKVYLVSTSLTKAIAEAAASGAPLVTQFIGEMGNDSGATQRVLFQGVKFTGKLDLAKFAAQQQTELDFEFSFTGFQYL